MILLVFYNFVFNDFYQMNFKTENFALKTVLRLKPN